MQRPAGSAAAETRDEVGAFFRSPTREQRRLNQLQRRRAQRNHLRAAADRRQDALGRIRQDDQNRPRRRFFQRFEQGVLRQWGDQVKVLKDGDAVPRCIGLQRQQARDIANRVDLQRRAIFARGQDEIGVARLADGAAGAAEAAGAPGDVIMLAVQRPGESQRQCPLAQRWRPRNQIPVALPPMQQAAPQPSHRPIMPNEAPSVGRRVFANQQVMIHHRDTESTDCLRLLGRSRRSLDSLPRPGKARRAPAQRLPYNS